MEGEGRRGNGKEGLLPPVATDVVTPLQTSCPVGGLMSIHLRTQYLASSCFRVTLPTLLSHNNAQCFSQRKLNVEQ